MEGYNERLERWESERLQVLLDYVPWRVTYAVAFRHARITQRITLKLGWFLVLLPQTHQPYRF